MMEPDTTAPEGMSRVKGRKMYKNLQPIRVSESPEMGD